MVMMNIRLHENADCGSSWMRVGGWIIKDGSTLSPSSHTHTPPLRAPNADARWDNCAIKKDGMGSSSNHENVSDQLPNAAT